MREKKFPSRCIVGDVTHVAVQSCDVHYSFFFLPFYTFKLVDFFLMYNLLRFLPTKKKK